MAHFPTQSISCHFASSDGHYIDVKNTTQAELEKELQEMVHRRYDMPALALKVGLLYMCFITIQFGPLCSVSLIQQFCAFCYSSVTDGAEVLGRIKDAEF